MKNKQRQKGARGTEARVKRCDLNDFVVHLSSYAKLLEFLSRI